MARDHRKLRVFHAAHRLTLAIYRQTRNFPRDEWFGLRAQLRRAAVSIPSNIVEGSARRSTGEYCNFLNISRASAGELLYLVELSVELEMLTDTDSTVRSACERLVAGMERLVQKVETLLAAEKDAKRRKRKAAAAAKKAQGPEPKA